MYIYIKEAKNNEDLIKKVDMHSCLKNIIIRLKKTFNIITIKKIDELHYLYIIPKIKNIKIIEKIIHRKRDDQEIILSRELKKYNKELNLKNENKEMSSFVYQILNYIMKKTDMKIELQKIYILANEYNEKNIQLIKYLADKVKTVNVVTNNTKKYSILEEKLYNDKGTLIVVTNNKIKALKRANIIINLDFKNEDINTYKINRNCIIINSTIEKIEILYFQGIIINNIDIVIEQNEKYKLLYEDFDMIDIYSSFEINSKKYIDNINKIVQDNVKVKNLIGNNGIIHIKEIVNISKNLDKL